MTPMQIFSLLFFTVFSVIMSGCAMNSAEEQPTTGALSFDLTSAEVSDLTEKAQSGDSAASLRLYRFYDFVKLDRDSALRWLRKSAQDGNPQGQYILGKTYMDDPAVKDQKKAIHWLSQAASNGYPEAQRALEEARGSVGSTQEGK